MKWYQCDIIKKSGDIKFWCRFIAHDAQDAEKRIETLLKKTLTGSIKNKAYLFAAKRYIDDFRITAVPENILAMYDLNKSSDVDLFYVKGKEG